MCLHVSVRMCVRACVVWSLFARCGRPGTAPTNVGPVPPTNVGPDPPQTLVLSLQQTLVLSLRVGPVPPPPCAHTTHTHIHKRGQKETELALEARLSRMHQERLPAHLVALVRMHACTRRPSVRDACTRRPYACTICSRRAFQETAIWREKQLKQRHISRRGQRDEGARNGCVSRSQKRHAPRARTLRRAATVRAGVEASTTEGGGHPLWSSATLDKSAVQAIELASAQRFISPTAAAMAACACARVCGRKCVATGMPT